VPCKRMSHPAKILIALCCFASILRAEDVPLHTQVNQLVAAREAGPVAERCDDATFLRRVSLDLIGRIPTVVELEAFLADTAEDKRAKTIDRLLNDYEYPRYMAVVFDLILMERRGNKHVKSPEFRSYLEAAFAKNQSYKELVAEILAADGTDEKTRAASAFYLERDVEPHLLTRDVGRIFFGMDVQCAQCHDHPIVDDYHQVDYYGLNAFFVRTSLFQPDKKKPALVAELASGEANFKSVFTDREGMLRPKIPGGEELIETTLKATDQYVVAPAKDVRPVPKESRLAKLSELISTQPSGQFDRNIANRIWAHLFGRGLVDPVDFLHSANPPTHPKVLEAVATEFAKSGYDVKWLLKELCLTDVYQRSFSLPSLSPSIETARQEIAKATEFAKQLTEQADQSAMQLEGLIEQLDAAVAEAKPFRDAEATANKAVADAAKARDAQKAKVDAAAKSVTDKEPHVPLVAEAVAKTEAATKVLKDDKELATALATLQKRHQAQVDAVNKLKAALKAEQDKLAAEQTKVATAEKAADEAIAARQPAEMKVHNIRQQVFDVREQTELLKAQAKTAERAAEYYETLVQYGETEKKIAQLEVTTQQSTQQLASTKTQVAEQQKKFEQLEATRKQKADLLAQRDKEMMAAQAALKAKQNSQAQLNTSISNAQAVLQSAESNEDLSNAVSLLQKSLAVIDQQVADATKLAEEKQQTAQAAKTALEQATATTNQSRSELDKLNSQQAQIEKALTTAQQQLVAERKSLETGWSKLVDESSNRFNVRGVSPLSPEQLALSMLIASGQFDRQRASETAKLNKEKPLSEEDAKKPEILAQRKEAIEANTYKALQGTINKFVKLYAPEEGQPQNVFFATAEQSLFLSNGGDLKSWLNPGGGNLTEQLAKLETPAEIANLLYKSVLSRTPTAVEIQDVEAFIQSRGDRKPAAIQDLAWALITSAEFRFQH